NLKTVVNNSSITNTGTWNNLQNSQIVNNADFTTLGDFRLDVGATMTGSGTLTVLDGLTTVNGLVVQFVEVNGGAFTGSGVVQGMLNTVGGSISPGNSPGTLTVVVSFVLDGGTLQIELD